MSDHKSIGVRLAIRREGRFVNAYLALEDTMTGATHLGSLMTGIAERADLFERWKQLMSDALAYAVEEMFGQTPNMIERKAPEHERSGDA